MKIVLLTLALSAVYADLSTSWVKPIYSNNKLLHYVQMARIFPDSKSFVDLQMKHSQKVITSEFEVLLNRTSNQPSKENLQEFINAHFVFGNELENWAPKDYHQNPAFLASIKDYKLKQFGQDINAIWPVLARKVKADVFKKPELYSIMPVHNGFFVPSGSFKEFYYWDTYWIIEGLLVSGMTDSAKGMISNLVELQRQYGHIPYGNRYYYEQRSQPPLLSAMMSLYIQATNDVEFLKANIDAIESELDYWLDTHSVVFTAGHREYHLLRYFAPVQAPRPESYYNDYVNAQAFDSEEAKARFYIDVQSGAESGWAFSSRWFIGKDGSNQGGLKDIRTSSIIPVDLNAIFANAMQNIASFYILLKTERKGKHWAHLAKQWRNSIKDILWDEKDGIWYDFDLENGIHRKYFYPSNVAPLWMNAVDQEFVKENQHKIMQYLKKSQALQFPGGVPTSLIRSGEQWDFPYSYPPLVSMMVNALEALQTEESFKFAFQIAQNFVYSAYKGFVTNKQMFEKYDVESPGKIEGSVYSAQPGYGWSNGVVLEMLAKYGHSLLYQDGYKPQTYFDTYKPQALPLYQSASHPTQVNNYQYFQKPIIPAFIQEPITQKPSFIVPSKYPVHLYPVTQQPSLSTETFKPAFPVNPKYPLTQKLEIQPTPFPSSSSYPSTQKPQYSISQEQSFPTSTEHAFTQKPVVSYTNQYPVSQEHISSIFEYTTTQKPALPVSAEKEYFPTSSEVPTTQKSAYTQFSGAKEQSFLASAEHVTTQKPVYPSYSQFTVVKEQFLPVSAEYVTTQKPISPSYSQFSLPKEQSFPVSTEFVTTQKPATPSYSQFSVTKEQPFPVSAEFVTTQKPATPSYSQFSVTKEQSFPVSSEFVTTQKPATPSYSQFQVVKEQYFPASAKYVTTQNPTTSEPDYVSSSKPDYPSYSQFSYKKEQSFPISAEVVTTSKPELESHQIVPVIKEQPLPLSSYNQFSAVKNETFHVSSEYVANQKPASPAYNQFFVIKEQSGSSLEASSPKPVLPSNSQFSVNKEQLLPVSAELFTTQKPAVEFHGHVEENKEQSLLPISSEYTTTQKPASPTYSQFAVIKEQLPSFNYASTPKPVVPSYGSFAVAKEQSVPVSVEYTTTQKPASPSYSSFPVAKEQPLSGSVEYITTQKPASLSYDSSSVAKEQSLPVSVEVIAAQKPASSSYSSFSVAKEQFLPVSVEFPTTQKPESPSYSLFSVAKEQSLPVLVEVITTQKPASPSYSSFSVAKEQSLPVSVEFPTTQKPESPSYSLFSVAKDQSLPVSAEYITTQKPASPSYSQFSIIKEQSIPVSVEYVQKPFSSSHGQFSVIKEQSASSDYVSSPKPSYGQFSVFKEQSPVSVEYHSTQKPVLPSAQFSFNKEQSFPSLFINQNPAVTYSKYPVTQKPWSVSSQYPITHKPAVSVYSQFPVTQKPSFFFNSQYQTTHKPHFYSIYSTTEKPYSSYKWPVPQKLPSPTFPTYFDKPKAL